MKGFLKQFQLTCLGLLFIAASSFAQKENYLVVVDDDYINSETFTEFVEYRKQLYNVTVKSQSESGSTAYQLRTTIKDLYNSDGLKYVLLIGGPGSALPYETDVHRTFHNFGLIDGDDMLDVALGCFFVSNETELANIIHKVMHTEKNIDTYPKVTTQFTSYTTRPHIEQQCGVIRDTYWKSNESEYEVSWMIPTYESKNNMQYVEDLRSQINSNATSIVSYQAHGGEVGWVDGGSYYAPESRIPGFSFDIEDVDQLTNDEVYPVIMSFGCVTGSFHKSGGFGEKWLTAKGGASAFIGSSELSGSYQKCFNAALAECWIDSDIQTLGELFLTAKNKLRGNKSHYVDLMSASFGSGDEEQMYNLYGDPGMHIKKTPTPIVQKITSSNTAGKSLAPVISNKTVSFLITEGGKYSVSVSTINGRVVSGSKSAHNLKAGINTVQLHTNNLSKGIYFLTVTGENINRTESFLIR